MTPLYNPVKFLPNQEGFEFYAYLRDGTEVKTIIKRNPETSLHYFDQHSNTLAWRDI
jgi:hypothetical protein